MKFTVLGCQTPYPRPDGATLGYLLQVENKNFLIDCGSGVISRLGNYIEPDQLDGVFLSHLHHDHISDVFVLQYAILTAKNLGKRESPLPIWSPVQPKEWYDRLSYSNFTVAKTLIEGQVISLDLNHRITFFPTIHGKITCFAMKIDGPHGCIVYGADSGPKTNWSQWVDQPDLLILEATYTEEIKKSLSLPTHLTAKEAGDIASRVRAKRLWLTHLSPGISEEQLYDEAKESFHGSLEVVCEGLFIDL